MKYFLPLAMILALITSAYGSEENEEKMQFTPTTQSTDFRNKNEAQR